MSQRVRTQRVTFGVAKRWWLILLLTFLGGGAGYLASLSVQPVYESTSSILVGQPFLAPAPTKDYGETSQQLALTYADVIRRQPVLAGVVDDLELDASWEELRDRVQVDIPPNNPQVIIVTVEAGSARKASATAKEIVEQGIELSPTTSQVQAENIQDFVSKRLKTLQHDIAAKQNRIDKLESDLARAKSALEIRDLRAKIAANQRLIIEWQGNYSSLLSFFGGQESPNYLQVLETAEKHHTPVYPDPLMYTALGAGVGFLLALGLAYILEFRRDIRLIERRPAYDPDPVGRTHSRERPVPPSPPRTWPIHGDDTDPSEATAESGIRPEFGGRADPEAGAHGEHYQRERDVLSTHRSIDAPADRDRRAR